LTKKLYTGEHKEKCNGHEQFSSTRERVGRAEFLNYWTGLYRTFFTQVSMSIMFALLGMISPRNGLWWLMDEMIEWRINKLWYVGVFYNFKGFVLYGCIGVYVKYCKTCSDQSFNQSINHVPLYWKLNYP
jgi:hypothetical protein